mmetsp:Transcript_5386/g.9049  ORF Transcript_5386/g.9049 Transcript_5386/m.9049 type:complete len:484 (-) Transcript_5386:110-1561(-)
MEDFPLIFTTGGDDRLPLDPKTGANKYHCKPFVLENSPFRGSCTCNTPTQTAFDAAKIYYEKLATEEVQIEEVMQEVRERLMEIYGLPEGTGIFLTPSGSDAEYIPLLIAKNLNPQRQIMNIVVCNEEVGSGTLDAAGGRFFSGLEPIPGFTSYADDGVDMGDPVMGLGEDVQTHAVIARNPDGSVVESDAQIEKKLESCKSSGMIPICHSVFGSKTGIIQDYRDKFASKVEAMDGYFVVDACQGRFEKEFLQDLVEKDAMVLITGSKFYRGPPFSGAVVIPPTIMNKLKEQEIANPIPLGLNTFIGKAEIPKELPMWRDNIADNQNPGLALRWIAALAEMEATLNYDAALRSETTSNWRNGVINMLEQYPNLNYFSSAEETPSIVSLRIRHPETGEWMVKSELAKVFKAMTLDMSEVFPEATEIVSKKCFTGQPVLISKSEAVLRIALGSDSLRDMIERPLEASKEDEYITRKLAFLGKHLN